MALRRTFGVRSQMPSNVSPVKRPIKNDALQNRERGGEIKQDNKKSRNLNSLANGENGISFPLCNTVDSKYAPRIDVLTALCVG